MTDRDSDGIERIPNQWGFNSFVSPEGAIQSVRRIGKPGSTWFVWRLSDGTYDCTATEHPDPPWHPAELVREIIAQPSWRDDR